MEPGTRCCPAHAYIGSATIMVYGRSISTVFGVVLCSGWFLFSCYWLWRRGRRRTVLPVVSHVLFFPDKVTTDAFSSPSKKKQQKGNFSILLEALESAQSSLDVCVFTISCQELSGVLINAHQRGVVVRVVTDNEQMSSSGSQIERLRRAGVQVRNDNTSYYMHHKFAVVDGKCLVNGSLNWTIQGVCGNQENVIITYNPQLVQPFVQQFEHLWDKYHPGKSFQSALIDE